LARDVLVRVFYALGDGDTPFRISIINIFLNAVLDFLLIKPFGAPGLVLATVGVNIVSSVALLVILHRRLHGLPWREWSWPILGLALGSAIAGVASWGTLQVCERFLGTEGLLIQLLELAVAGSVGLAVFGIFATQLRLPEVDLFVDRIRQRLLRR
jgi:putative peptidoglycan lipid II flippase